MVRRQFLAPPNLPANTVTRCLVIPDSREWLGIFNDALLELAQAFNYEQVNDTDLTPEDVAAICFNIYVEYLQGECMDCFEVANCLAIANQFTRFNPTTGEMERSTDGGQTWESARDIDPRFVGPTTGPMEDTATCDNANAIVGFMQQVVEEIMDQADATASLVALGAAILGVLSLIFTFGAAGPVVAVLAASVVGLTRSAIEAAMTSQVWEDMRCLIACEIEGQTDITAENYDAIMGDLGDVATGIAFTIIHDMLMNLGPVGMQNAANLGIAPVGIPATCDDCACAGAWCYEMDLLTDDYDEFISQFDGTYTATWTVNEGWGKTAQGGLNTGIKVAFGITTNITAWEFEYLAGGNGYQTVRNISPPYGFEHQNYAINIVSELNDEGNFSLGELSEWSVAFTTGNNPQDPNRTKNVRVRRIRFYGDGVNPFGASNCEV